MLMAFDIEKSIKKRGTASPMEIFADIKAHDDDDRKAATKLIVELVQDGHVEAREIRTSGFRIPMFCWNYRHGR